jgi:superfamily II DNA helicase RecQ
MRCSQECGASFYGVVDQELGTLSMIGIIAMTTLRAQQGSLKNLAIENTTAFTFFSNREPLYYEISPKTRAKKHLTKFIKRYPKASNVVYCHSRKKMRKLEALLNLNDTQSARVMVLDNYQ